MTFKFIVKMRRKDWRHDRSSVRVVDAETHTEAEDKARALIGGPNADAYAAFLIAS
jgi:hypothetical protein